MKSTFTFTMLLFISFFGYCQSSSAMSKSKVAIKSNFNAEAIVAYQEKASTKIEDYFYYLELYSNQKTAETLKKEVKIILNDLFYDNETIVFDCTKKGSNSSTLSVMLQNIENKNFTFKATNFNTKEIQLDSWITTYDVLVSNGSESNLYSLTSKIYFKPIQKQFGTEKKEVWSLFLGSIDCNSCK